MDDYNPEQAREVVRQFLARLKGIDSNPLPVLKGVAQMILEASPSDQEHSIAHTHLDVIEQLETLPTATRALTSQHAKLIQKAHNLFGDNLMSNQAWHFFQSFAEREKLFTAPELNDGAKQSIHRTLNRGLIDASLINAKKATLKGRITPENEQDQARA